MTNYDPGKDHDAHVPLTKFYLGLALCGLVMILSAGRLLEVPVPMLALRGLALLSLTWCVWVWLSARRYSFLLSPLFILGAFIICLYVTLPALTDYFQQALEDASGRPFLSRTADSIRIFLGSKGEGLLLLFAATSLASTLVTDRLVVLSDQPKDIGDPRPKRIFVGLAATLICLSIVLQEIMKNGLAEGASSHWILTQLQFIGFPALSLAVILICFHPRRRDWFLFTVVALLGVLSVVAFHSAKGVILIMAAGFLFYLARKRPMIRHVVLVSGCVFLSIWILLFLMNFVRGTLDDYDAHHNLYVWDTLVHKLAVRQGVTGYCLNNVIAQAATSQPEHGPLYFSVAFIPRILWREKPTLSNGFEYGLKYCGKHDPLVEGRTPHSASITLLGEPLDKAGWAGLFLAFPLLIGGLGYLTLLCGRNGVQGQIFLGALLPWLIDFDQQFAMYLAHIVKVSIILAIFGGAWKILARGLRREGLP